MHGRQRDILIEAGKAQPSAHAPTHLPTQVPHSPDVVAAQSSWLQGAPACILQSKAGAQRWWLCPSPSLDAPLGGSTTAAHPSGASITARGAIFDPGLNPQRTYAVLLAAVLSLWPYCDVSDDVHMQAFSNVDIMS